MRTIYKYGLEPIPEQTVSLPENAKVLSVQVQQGQLNLWAMVDPKLPCMKKTIRIYPTGGQLPESPGVFFGTVQLFNGDIVIHVFIE